MPAPNAHLRAAGAAGNLTAGAQVAAIAADNNATMCPNDSDFARFDDIRWQNALIA